MRLLWSTKSGVDLIVGQAVAPGIGINRISMRLVVTQGIEHLCKRDVRQAEHNLFGDKAKTSTVQQWHGPACGYP